MRSKRRSSRSSSKSPTKRQNTSLPIKLEDLIKFLTQKLLNLQQNIKSHTSIITDQIQAPYHRILYPDTNPVAFRFPKNTYFPSIPYIEDIKKNKRFYCSKSCPILRELIQLRFLKLDSDLNCVQIEQKKSLNLKEET